jgi:phage terminase Nu1 subunit (DNA packaging protein)
MLHTMVISASTERKLTHLRDELHREFTTLTPEHIDRQVQDVERRILEQARFDDFVPVLVDRYVRQRLTKSTE